MYAFFSYEKKWKACDLNLVIKIELRKIPNWIGSIVEYAGITSYKHCYVIQHTREDEIITIS